MTKFLETWDMINSRQGIKGTDKEFKYGQESEINERQALDFDFTLLSSSPLSPSEIVTGVSYFR